MTKKNQDFEVYQGDDRDIEIELTDEDDAVLNISGASATWKMSVSARGSVKITKVPSLATVGGKSVANFPITPNDTTNEQPGDYYHECEVVDAAGKTFTASVGTMTINRALIK